MDEIEETVTQEKVTRKMIEGVSRYLGVGAMLISFDKIDYEIGRVEINGKDSWDYHLWTTDGYRIEILAGRDGGMMASQTKEVDEDRPDPMFPGYDGS